MKKKAVAKEPEGEVLFATVNDPEGMLAGDLCALAFRRCYMNANFEKRAVAGREDAFEVVAVNVADYYRDRLEAALREWSAEVSRWEYPDPVPLGFDPETLTDPRLSRIWRDPLARSLWTGLRFRRLVSEGFDASVEECADFCRMLQRRRRFSRAELNRYFWRMSCFGSAELTGVAVARLWPYLTGEKVFNFKVEEKGA